MFHIHSFKFPLVLSQKISQFRGFRIPMRGYDAVQNLTTALAAQVPNPHEGL